MIYLDSSAIVKLVRLEPESRALVSYLMDHPDRVTSVLSAVEVPRAVRRSTSSRAAVRRVDGVLARLNLIELDEAIRARASSLEPMGLRTLDAIHIASAIDLGSDVFAFVTYDERQTEGARHVHLGVASPRA